LHSTQQQFPEKYLQGDFWELLENSGGSKQLEILKEKSTQKIVIAIDFF
jgi:hypothetical protein